MGKEVMRKFQRNSDKKELTPSQAQINRQKDFARLHHDYEKVTKRGKKPLFRDPKLFVLLFLLALIAFLIFMEGK